MIDLHTFYTALLSGVLEKHNENEYWWEGENDPFTVEIVDLSQQKYIVRHYWANGNKLLEIGYQNGKLHGKSIRWYRNGNKCWEGEYQNGKRHGKHIEWYENGSKYWEKEYQNGELYGKYIEWHKNGSKHWEEEYQNGEQIK